MTLTPWHCLRDDKPRSRNPSFAFMMQAVQELHRNLSFERHNGVHIATGSCVALARHFSSISCDSNAHTTWNQERFGSGCKGGQPYPGPANDGSLDSAVIKVFLAVQSEHTMDTETRLMLSHLQLWWNLFVQNKGVTARDVFACQRTTDWCKERPSTMCLVATRDCNGR